MTRTQLLLVCLMEECDELSQRASKALRFGAEEIQEGQELTNSERMQDEYTDLIGVIELLRGVGVMPYVLNNDKIEAKKAKVEKYILYSAQVGVLKEY